jgi:hypothetical protein
MRSTNTQRCIGLAKNTIQEMAEANLMIDNERIAGDTVGREWTPSSISLLVSHAKTFSFET